VKTLASARPRRSPRLTKGYNSPSGSMIKSELTVSECAARYVSKSPTYSKAPHSTPRSQIASPGPNTTSCPKHRTGGSAITDGHVPCLPLPASAVRPIGVRDRRRVRSDCNIAVRRVAPDSHRRLRSSPHSDTADVVAQKSRLRPLPSRLSRPLPPFATTPELRLTPCLPDGTAPVLRGAGAGAFALGDIQPPSLFNIAPRSLAG